MSLRYRTDTANPPSDITPGQTPNKGCADIVIYVHLKQHVRNTPLNAYHHQG